MRQRRAISACMQISAYLRKLIKRRSPISRKAIDIASAMAIAIAIMQVRVAHNYIYLA